MNAHRIAAHRHVTDLVEVLRIYLQNKKYQVLYNGIEIHNDQLVYASPDRLLLTINVTVNLLDDDDGQSKLDWDTQNLTRFFSNNFVIQQCVQLDWTR